MKIHCINMKQIKKGQYRLNADGIVEVQGYSYPVDAGTIVSPTEETVMISDASGNHYVWTFVPQKSEWESETGNIILILERFNGVWADVLIVEKDHSGNCKKSKILVKYIDLFYDLQRYIRMYLKTST